MKLRDVLKTIIVHDQIDVIIETELDETFIHWTIYDYDIIPISKTKKELYNFVYFPGKIYVMSDDLNPQFDLLDREVTYLEALGKLHFKISCYLD